MPQILAALENDPSILVQNSAVDALSNFSEQSAVKGLHNQGSREAALPISRISLKISRHLDNHTTQELFSEPLPVLADLSFQLAALEAITDLRASLGLEALLMAARPRHIPRDSSIALKIAEGFYRQRRAALYGLGYTCSREAVRFLTF